MSVGLISLCVRGDRAVSIRHHAPDGSVINEPLQRTAATGELARLARMHPEACLAWYDERIASDLSDIATWPSFLRHRLEILHISCFVRMDLVAASIGLVDFDSWQFFEGPRDRRYGTWLISPTAGIAHAKLLTALAFDGSLASLATALLDVGGRGMRRGVCPYSEPRLLNASASLDRIDSARPALSPQNLALLVRRVFGSRWVPFWFGASFLSSGTFHPIAALRAWWAGPAMPIDIGALKEGRPPVDPQVKAANPPRVVAIVPTLGRAKCVADLLEDLARQTVAPRTVVLVEQIPNPSQSSELLALVRRRWPFEIRHHIVNWTGACRARNLGLAQELGDWTLFLDDDVRVTPGFVAYLLAVADVYGVDVVSAATYLPKARPPDSRALPRLGSTFSGSSLVSRRTLATVSGFNEQLEGGWGEDLEFGIRMRRQGATVLHVSGEPVLHLQAPIGGFRTQLSQPWDRDSLKPRPAPTVLLSRRDLPGPMQSGYRSYYILKRLSAVSPPRALTELPMIILQWRRSMQWVERFLRRSVTSPPLES